MELSHYLWMFLLFLIPVFYLFLHKESSSNIRLPPGTTGLPLIGESLSFYLKIRKGAQLEFITDRMHKYSSKIFRTSLMGEPMAVLGDDAEGNKFLFSNENKLVEVWFASRMNKIFPRTINNPPHVQSKWLRNIIVPLILKADGLRWCVGVMDAVMKQHLETFWSGNNQVKLVEMAKKYTLALQCNVFLGVNDLGKIENLLEGMDEIEDTLIAVPINLPGTTWNRGIKASKVMRSKVEAMVRERKTHLSISSPTNVNLKDFIAHMLLTVDENGELLKEEDIACQVVGLIEGGYTTTMTTITMLMKTLAEIPHVYDSVLKEQKEIASLRDPKDKRLTWEYFEKMKYSWNVVREVLRVYSHGLGGFKEAIIDFTYQGYTIPKGWKVHWLPQATHMNPKYFEDPEKFDPTRFDGDGPIPYTFVPFGAGLRMCPGNQYAKFAVLTFLHYVVTQFRWEKVNPREKLRYSFVATPAQGLPIHLYPHQH